MPDGNIDPQKLEEITRREVEAGRMASDDDFRKFTVVGADVFTPPTEIPESPHGREAVEVLRALAALQKDAQHAKPALLTRLRQKLTTIKLSVAIAKWRASPVGQALEKHTNFYISDATILGSHSDSYKRKLIAELYESVATIYGAESPFLKCRQTLATYIDSYADWTVLALKPEEKLALGQDDPRNSPYISGELYHHIRCCAQYNGELAHLISKHMPDEELIAWANARSCTFHYLMQGINMVRVDVNDVDPKAETNWLRSFVKSMLISKEDFHRNKIGLPTLLPGGAVNLSWQHSSFMTLVMNGHRDPLSRWEVIHKLTHGDVS
jgi:hypothetical protein